MTWLRKGFYPILGVTVVAVIGFILFHNLGHLPLADYDEGIYAQVAQESLHNGNQLDLTWLGNTSLGRSADWFEKPPLFLWLVELSLKVFGSNEFAARLPVATFALATVILTYKFVLDAFKSHRASALSTSFFLVSYQFLRLGHVLQLDIAVGFFILLSLWGFYRAKADSRFWYVFGLGVGLGIMAKSVIGLIPLPVVFITSLVQWDFSFLKSKHFYLGILLAIGIAVPWHLIETFRHGHKFWDSYIFYHVFKRYNQIIEQHLTSKWYYWEILKPQRILFVTSALGFFYFLFQTLRRRLAFVTVLSATVFILLFFSSSKTKLPAYIVVIYPFFAILAGVVIDRIIKVIKIKVFAIIATIAVVCGCIFFGIRYNNYRQVADFIPAEQDNKTVGLFLAKNYIELPVYCDCANGTRPASIFYSDRPLLAQGYPGIEPPFGTYLLISEARLVPSQAQLLLDTPSKGVYLVNK